MPVSLTRIEKNYSRVIIHQKPNSIYPLSVNLRASLTTSTEPVLIADICYQIIPVFNTF